MRRPFRRPITALVAASLAGFGLTACSSNSSSTSAPTAASNCTPSALSAASGTVTLNFWESAARANATVLTNLTNAFNASQTKVHVNLVQQTSYADTWQKITSGLSNGELPDVAQIQDSDTQGAVDTGAFAPVQSCIDGYSFATSDFLPRALNYFKVGGKQWGMPFAISGPVLYYNKTAFSKAGISGPPSTLTDLEADAKTLKTAGLGGFGLKVDPWYLETWLATANQLEVNNENGRAGRTTAAVFNGTTAQSAFTSLDQMVQSGDASTNSVNGADAYDNLLGVGQGKYSMTIDTSAALGTIEQILSSGQYPNVTLGVAPFPTVASPVAGGVQPAGSALWISSKMSAAKQAAAWEFISYLTSTSSQATWAAGTGYLPIRMSSANSSTIQHLWATTPGFKVAYTQLLSGISTPASAGAAMGPFDSVRTAIANAENSMFDSGVSPKSAVSTAATQATQIIQSYNQRLG